MGRGSEGTVRSRILATLLAAVLGASAAGAAEMPLPETEPPAPPVFEDWALVCAEDCAARTAIVGRDGTEVLTLTARAAEGGAFVIATPLPLFLPDPVRLTLGSSEPRGIPWRTCGPAGCEARAPLDPALLAGLRRERAGSVELTLETGERVRFGVSLLGFTAAWRALSDSP
jgi:invasion protein IalB